MTHQSIYDALMTYFFTKLAKRVDTITRIAKPTFGHLCAVLCLPSQISSKSGQINFPQPVVQSFWAALRTGLWLTRRDCVNRINDFLPKRVEVCVQSKIIMIYEVKSPISVHEDVSAVICNICNRIYKIRMSLLDFTSA
jgi:hypothetical protein